MIQHSCNHANFNNNRCTSIIYYCVILDEISAAKMAQGIMAEIEK